MENGVWKVEGGTLVGLVASKPEKKEEAPKVEEQKPKRTTKKTGRA